MCSILLLATDEKAYLFSIPIKGFVFDKQSEAAVRNAKARTLSRQKAKNQGEWDMKEKLCGILRLFGIDKLLLRLFERLVSGLNKKHEELKNFFRVFSPDMMTATEF